MRERRNGTTWWIRTLIGATLFALVPVAPAPVRAAMYPCTEMGVDAALAAGGTATFGCTAATTITIGATKSVSVSGTILDGSGLLTLSGGSGSTAKRVLQVNANITAELRNLTIANGKTPDGNPGTPGVNAGNGDNGGDGGGILNNGSLTLTGVIVRDNATGGGGGGYNNANGGNGGRGGGIFTTGPLTLVGSTVRNNTTGRGGNGGDGTSASPAPSPLRQPAAVCRNCGGLGGNGGFGGGIYVTESGTLSLTESTVRDNTAGAGGFGGTAGTGTPASGFGGTGGNGGNGGGVAYALTIPATTTATLTRSTISGNTAGAGNTGGAGFNRGGYGGDGGSGGGLAGGPFVLTNSTVSGNTAGQAGTTGGTGALDGVGGSGGGIDSGGDGLRVTLTNVTVSGNAAGVSNSGSGAGNASGSGGGIRSSAQIQLRHSVVAANTVPSNGFSPDLVATVVSGSTFNVVGDGAGANGLMNGTNGNRVGGNGAPALNPLLGPLANNGGPTLTRLPQPGSPLIDGGDTTCPTGITTDQRGIPRPQGAKCDIGAVEVGTAPTPTPNPAPPTRPPGTPNATTPRPQPISPRAVPTTAVPPVGATPTNTPLPAPIRR